MKLKYKLCLKAISNLLKELRGGDRVIETVRTLELTEACQDLANPPIPLA